MFFLLFSEVIFDKKRHLIGEEFFKHPASNSDSHHKSVVGGEPISTAEDLTRIPTIVTPSKLLVLEVNCFKKSIEQLFSPCLGQPLDLCLI